MARPVPDVSQQRQARGARHGYRAVRGRELLDSLAARKLARQRLGGVKLVVADTSEGFKAAVAKVLTATWQRCRVHFMHDREAPVASEDDVDQYATAYWSGKELPVLRDAPWEHRALRLGF